MTSLQHVYEVRRLATSAGVDLISDALPFTGLSYGAAIRASSKSSHRSRRKTRSNDVRAFDRQEQPPGRRQAATFLSLALGAEVVMIKVYRRGRIYESEKSNTHHPGLADRPICPDFRT